MKRTAEMRWHMSNRKYMVESQHTTEGRRELEKLRRTIPALKYSRIRAVLQAYPSQIQYYKIYNRGWREDDETKKALCGYKPVMPWE